MTLDSLIDEELAAHRAALDALKSAIREPFGRLVDAVGRSLGKGGKLLLFGNGGSAADAQHIATEFTIRYLRERKALASIALTTDSSALTACANDYSFDHIFSRQIEALGRPGDVVIGISTSGNSGNVLEGLKVAREMGLVPAGLTGRDGGRMTECADPLIIVPAQTTARIQEMHIIIGHLLCEAIDRQYAG